MSGSDEFSVWNCTRLTVDAQWVRVLLRPDARGTLVSLPLWGKEDKKVFQDECHQTLIRQGLVCAL